MREITGVTILGEESQKELVFIPVTKKKIKLPKRRNLTKEDKKRINQDIYLNCMYLKKHLVR